ncbi:MAG TPA: hypothetical protein VHS07_01995, partial [Candidatus Binataceae bacterium]|nr:hypothetical protein [Candidatus Binataceae bacterium]
METPFGNTLFASSTSNPEPPALFLFRRPAVIRSSARLASSIKPLWRRLARTTGAALSAGMIVTATLAALAPQSAHADETAICYNCPPEWADWASQIKA